MGSKLCCTSRAPPSPDGLAPRTARRLSPAKKNLNRGFATSLSPASSFLSNLNDAADLRAIFEDDKSSIGDSTLWTNPKRSRNTIRDVTDRLKKRLSRDMSITDSIKRRSRCSAGGSEEEIERRAELRRFRQKRIEDELSNDIYDDDAKSLSIRLGGNSTQGRAGHSTRSREHLPPPLRTQPSYASLEVFRSDLDFLTSSVPDQFTNDEECILLPLSHIQLLSPTLRSHSVGQLENRRNYSSQTKVESFTSAKALRRHTFPKIVVDSTSFEPGICLPKKDIISPLPVSTRPILQAMRLPSITDPALHSSWRLSFTASNRGEQLRKLSGGDVSTTLPPSKCPTAVGTQPLEKWLRSHSIHLSSQEMAISDDSGVLEYISPIRSKLEDAGGVDGSPDSKSPMHLYEMEISQRLAPGDESATSTKPPSKQGNQTTRHLLGSSVYSHSTQSYISNYKEYPNSITPSGSIPDSWGNLFGEEYDTLYCSAANIVQPSPAMPDFDLLEIASQKDGSDVEVTNGSLFLISSSNLSDFHLDGSVAFTAPLPRISSCPIEDLCQVSESGSMNQDEVEPMAVKRMFLGSESGLKLAIPVMGGLQEKLEMAIDINANSSFSKSRQSGVSYTHEGERSACDGTMEKMLGVPLPPPSPADRRTNTIGSSTEDAASAIWGKAVKEAHQEDKTELGRKKSIFPHNLGRKTNSRRANRQRILSDEDSHIKQGDYDTLMAKKNEVIDNWACEMEETSRRAKARSKTAADRIVRQTKNGVDRRYPTSWSKYPSFNRRDRLEHTKSGIPLDSIERRDFAIYDTTGKDTMWYSNEQSRHPQHYNSDECLPAASKDFFKNIGDKFKSHTSQSAIKNSQLMFDQTYGRKGSVVPSVPLQYPELEILAVESKNLMTGDEIEEHVEKISHQEEIQKKDTKLQRKQFELLDATMFGTDKVSIGSTTSEARETTCKKKAKRAAEDFFERKKRFDQFGMELLEPSASHSLNRTIGSPAGERTGRVLEKTSNKTLPGAVKAEVIDMDLKPVHMSRATLKRQISKRMALKKRVRERKRADIVVKRDTGARTKPDYFKPEPFCQVPIILEPAVQWSTRQNASESGTDQRTPYVVEKGSEVLSKHKIEKQREIGNSPISIEDQRLYEYRVVRGVLNTPWRGQPQKPDVIKVIQVGSLKLHYGDSYRLRTCNNIASSRYGPVRLVRSFSEFGLKEGEGTGEDRQQVMRNILELAKTMNSFQ